MSMPNDRAYGCFWGAVQTFDVDDYRLGAFTPRDDKLTYAVEMLLKKVGGPAPSPDRPHPVKSTPLHIHYPP